LGFVFVQLTWMLFGSLFASGASLGDFTVVVLPDPQNYTQYYPQIFDSQTQWIAANASAQNIKLVLEVGDTVNHAQAATEWQNADHSFSILDQANVPYAIAIGNHDYDVVPPTNRQSFLLQPVLRAFSL
jgi:hypothetical protein